MKRIVAALVACASVWASGDEGILDEVNAGRRRTAEAVHSYYVRYTVHHVSMERLGDDLWVQDVEVVVERWRDGDKYRVRQHSVETNTKDGAPVEGVEPPPAFRLAYRAMERDALLTPTDAYTRSRYTLGPDAGIHLNPPLGATRTADSVRRAATNQARPGDWLDWAFQRHLTAAYDDSKGVWDFGTPIYDRARQRWSRRGPYVMLRCLPKEGGDVLPGYYLFDPGRGHLVVAHEEGAASWADAAVLSDEQYASVHFEHVEAAPGIWLPKAKTRRYLTSTERSHSELRVLDLRVNEPIDAGVFDRSNAGQWHSPRPAGSVFPGEVVPVHRASTDEVTGEGERRAALEGGPPREILEYALRGDDGLPPIAAQAETSTEGASPVVAASIVVGVLAALCGVTLFFVRREG